jgi:hypothetical protein
MIKSFSEWFCTYHIPFGIIVSCCLRLLKYVGSWITFLITFCMLSFILSLLWSSSEWSSVSESMSMMVSSWCSLVSPCSDHLILSHQSQYHLVYYESMERNLKIKPMYSGLEETCHPGVFSFPHFSISPWSFCTRNVTSGTNPLCTVQVQREMEKVEKRKLWGDTFPATRCTSVGVILPVWTSKARYLRKNKKRTCFFLSREYPDGCAVESNASRQS